MLEQRKRPTKYHCSCIVAEEAARWRHNHRKSSSDTFTVWLLHIGDGAPALVSSVPASLGVRAFVLLFNSRRCRLCRARISPLSFSCLQAPSFSIARRPVVRANLKHLVVPTSITNHLIQSQNQKISFFLSSSKNMIKSGLIRQAKCSVPLHGGNGGPIAHGGRGL